ncbi:hypothetical protein CMI42_05670 [Candidatus Pacearchaeota archaeon]|nr:hypothetical protein [Candidatus Pacearchaeota archaeon]
MVAKKDSPRIEGWKKKSRRHSITEGIFCSAKNSFGHHYVAPFAIAVNSSSSLVAMLSSVQGLLGPLSQLFGSRFPEKYSRKKIMLKTVFFESLMWLPFIAIAILFHKGILLQALPILVLFSFALYIIAGNLGYPAWFSWMGDIVEKKKRGRYFSKRNLLVGFVSVILAISAALLLDYFKKNSMLMQGFGILFFLALLSRLISWKIFHKQYEPKIKLKKGYYFSFWDFTISSTKNNFGRFTLFRFFFTLTTTISGALLAVYLLKHLNFSYTTYMIIIFSGTAFSLLVLEFWGKFIDKYGSYRALCIAAIMMPFVPILWILDSNPIYLIFPSVINGIAWAGIHLSEKNFIYDNVSNQKRGLAVSYYNMFWGIGTFLGALTGAFLIKILDTNFIQPIILIFIIGAVARGISVIWWLPKMREIRKIRKFTISKAFEEIALKEAAPTINEEVSDIIHIKKYLNFK